MSSATARRNVVEALSRKGQELGGDWAFQGQAGAADTWVTAGDHKDLDVWARDDTIAHQLGEVLASHGGVRISGEPSPPRIRHHVWWLPTGDTNAVVDITVGDLGAGPVTVVPAGRVVAEGGQLKGEAAVFDLIGRRLLSGRTPEEPRVRAGREAFAELTGAGQPLAGWPETIRRAVVAVLDGDRGPGPARRCRAYLAVRSLRHLGATWRNRHQIFGRRKSALSGLPSRGLSVAFIGVDGSGKSTMLEASAERLQSKGCAPRRMYLGMIRGNLPVVDRLRRTAHKILGYTETTTGDNETEPRQERRSEPRVAERMVRWMAGWVYAVDLVWRMRKVQREVRRGRVVLCDRWVYDLSLDPLPNHLAGRMLGRAHPDMVVLCDGDVVEMAARKDGGDPDEIERRQNHYRACAKAARRQGRVVVEIDTVNGPGVTADAARIMSAVVAATHRAAEFYEEGAA